MASPQLVIVPSLDPNMAGAVVWWRLSGGVSHERLQEAWAEAGLDVKLLPLPPTPEQALRRSMREQEERRKLVRPLGNGKWALVQEKVEADDLAYSTELKVGTNAVGEVEFDPAGHALEPAIREAFAQHSGQLSQGDISTWLVERVFAEQAVSLRDTGGIYFVPREHLESWRTVVRVLRSASSHALFEVPALRTDEAVDAILDAVSNEAKDDIQNLEKALEGDELGARALSNRSDKAGRMLEKLKSYESLLGRSLDVFRERLESLQTELATAALAAGSDE